MNYCDIWNNVDRQCFLERSQPWLQLKSRKRKKRFNFCSFLWIHRTCDYNPCSLASLYCGVCSSWGTMVFLCNVVSQFTDAADEIRVLNTSYWHSGATCFHTHICCDIITILSEPIRYKLWRREPGAKSHMHTTFSRLPGEIVLTSSYTDKHKD